MSYATPTARAVGTCCLLATALSAGVARADWVAGRDLALNELGAAELTNPNGTVPAWSYGYRAAAASDLLTLFGGSGQHHNNIGGHAGLDGWANGASVLVNTTASPISTNNGFGPNAPIPPQALLLHPAPDNQFAVVRFTAPAAGEYTVSASWLDTDPHGGNGASGVVTLNGASVFAQDFDNGGNASLPAQTLTLAAGDRLDFLVGSRGDWAFDSTAFDAAVAVVPEPASLALAAVPAAAAFGRRRRA